MATSRAGRGNAIALTTTTSAKRLLVPAQVGGDRMWCRKTDEFTGRNDFGLLPELRKMPAIACNKVIGTGLVSAFKKDIVARKAHAISDNKRPVSLYKRWAPHTARFPVEFRGFP
jgi:hypothetical protein